MDKITNWLSEKFQHPLSLLFFIIGTLLILFGISNSLNVPGLSEIIPNEDFRWLSIISGFVLLLVSIALYYFPPKQTNKHLKKGADDFPQEFSLSLLGRRESISDQQNEILRFFVAEARFGQYLSQDMLEQKFPQYGRSEMFYRLENLRLLGFLVNQLIGKDLNDGADRFSYRLSDAYRKELAAHAPISQKMTDSIPSRTIQQSVAKSRKSKKRSM